jgi:hypothetical protein
MWVVILPGSFQHSEHLAQAPPWGHFRHFPLPLLPPSPEPLDELAHRGASNVNSASAIPNLSNHDPDVM